MTAFFAGLLCRLAASNRATITKETNRQPPLRVDRPDPQLPAVVQVRQEGTFIVIDGQPDPGSLEIKHEAGATADPHSDRIVIGWTSGGERQTKSFDLYKAATINGGRCVVQNVEYVEFSGGRGRNKYWCRTKITS